MKKVPPDLMDRLARKTNAEGTREEHGTNTERTQQKHRENTVITRLREYDDKARATFSIRIDSQDRERLQRYFESRGLKLTQGIRMIIKEYMERQGI